MKVVFYFDLISPYTYWAWQTLKRYKTLWNLEIEFRPVHLGAVMTSSGNVTPAAVPNRAKFIFNDLRRNAKWFNLEHAWKGVPVNLFQDVGKVARPLNRLLCVVCSEPTLRDEKKWAAVDGAFALIWEDQTYREGEMFVVPPAMEEIMKKILVHSKIDSSYLKRVNSQGSELLKANTDKALDIGAFGSPTFQIEGDSQLFFGSDRFEQMAFLFKKRWLGPNPSFSKL